MEPKQISFCLLLCWSISLVTLAVSLIGSRPRDAGEHMDNLTLASHSNQSRKQEADEDDKMVNSNSRKHPYFTKMKFGPLYVFGGIIGNSSDKAQWDIVKLYASVHKTFDRKQISCCFKFHTGIGLNYYRQPFSSFTKPTPTTELSSCHYTCLNPRPGVIPDGIALTINNFTCSENHVTYREPFVPLLEDGIKIALCTKASYGTRSAELIIEWMETHTYLGVDKVVSYYLKDLNTDAKRVLEYYARSGKLDLYYFEPAAAETLKRRYHPPDQQSRSDKQLLIFDSFERMSGYTYFGVIDHDEFLIPPNGVSLKDYLANLYKRYEDAAGFAFLSELYFLQFGQSGVIGDLILQRYITTTAQGPQFIAQKNIYKPTYMAYGQVQTHSPKPKKGFRMVKLMAEEGLIRHYRDGCYGDCNKFSNRKNDTWASEWSRRIEKKVKIVRQKIFEA